MKRYLILLTAVCLLCIFSIAGADATLPNPSVYSAGDIIGKLPSFWIANYIEIQELMKEYPDFQC